MEQFRRNTQLSASTLQTVHSKAQVDLNNIESIFTSGFDTVHLSCVMRALKCIALSMLLAGCNSFKYGGSGVSCLAEEAKLLEGIEVATAMVSRLDENIVYTFTISTDYGSECGFWFDAGLPSDIPGYLLAGPTEIVLAKESWEYVTTNYYSHEF